MSDTEATGENVAVITLGLSDVNRVRFEKAAQEAVSRYRGNELRLRPRSASCWDDLLSTTAMGPESGAPQTGCYVVRDMDGHAKPLVQNLRNLWNANGDAQVLLLCETTVAQSVHEATGGNHHLVTMVPPAAIESVLPVVISLSAKRLLACESHSQAQQLIAAKRLANLGPIASGIAHDFNNLLTAIMSFGELARESLPPDELAYEDLGEVLKAADCAAGLTQQLQSFAKMKSATDSFGAFDLNVLLEKRASLVESMLGETIRVEMQYSRNPALVFGDEAQIEQLIVDLVAHQRESAGSRGGDLAIQTFRSPQTTTLRLTLSGPQLVAHPETFKTHQASQEILRRHAAVLKTPRAEDNSICVMLDFPTRAPNDHAEPDEQAQTPSKQVGRVLVVDDKKDIRDLCGRILQEQGYTTSLAASGSEALEFFRTNEVDILVTDLVMPGINGLDLYDMIRVFNPKLGVVFMSGYPMGLLGEAPVDGERQCFLQKPFVPARLIESVRTVCQRRG